MYFNGFKIFPHFILDCISTIFLHSAESAHLKPLMHIYNYSGGAGFSYIFAIAVW